MSGLRLREYAEGGKEENSSATHDQQTIPPRGTKWKTG
jgi:hypothetical protein